MAAETKKTEVPTRCKGTHGLILAEARRHAESCGWTVAEIAPNPEHQYIDYGRGLEPGDKTVNFLPRTVELEPLFGMRDRPGFYETTPELTTVPAWPQAILFVKASNGKLFSLAIIRVSELTEECFRKLIATQ